MVPYKKSRGSEAFRRLRVFISVPEEYRNRQFKRPGGAENNLKCKTMSIGKLSEKLGAKKTW